MFIIEWKTAADHSIKDDTTTPNVNLLSAIRLARNDFGSRVVWRPARSTERHAIFGGVGQAEVDQLDVMILVE